MMRLVFMVMLSLVAVNPAWAAGGCCAVVPGDAVAAAVSGADSGRWGAASGESGGSGAVSWSGTPRGSACPCCPTGGDCQHDRCCGGPVAGSMLAGPGPLRVVFPPSTGWVAGFIPRLSSRAIARDARPPIPLRY